MPSTLYRPHRHQQVASVVDLDAARARLRGAPRNQPRTLLVRCATSLADETILRHIGLSSDTSLEDVRRSLHIAFSVPGDTPTPSRFTLASSDQGRLDTAGAIGQYLHEGGDELFFHWGLWRFTLTLLDIYPRDDATPRALCVAGAGDFAGEPFDVAAINAQLLGPSAVENVLASVRPEVVDIVSRSTSMDFLPLLQALDLSRPAELDSFDASVAQIVNTLPREQSREARDAFWCTILALSCLVDETTTDDVTESAMAALGWSADNGSSYSAGQIKQLCAGSLVRLASVGGYGTGGRSAVDKLDIYRALLRVK